MSNAITQETIVYFSQKESLSRHRSSRRAVHLCKRTFAALASALAIILGTSCSWFQPEPYILMWSPDTNVDIFVDVARFDGRGNAAPGTIGGGPKAKLGDGGKAMALFSRTFPKRGTFVWRDLKSGKVFRGELIYPDNLGQIADDLEETYAVQTTDRPQKARRILMTGFSNDHQVIGWITNAGGGPGVVHRDIREVARAQGVEVIAPQRGSSASADGEPSTP